MVCKAHFKLNFLEAYLHLELIQIIHVIAEFKYSLFNDDFSAEVRTASLFCSRKGKSSCKVLRRLSGCVGIRRDAREINWWINFQVTFAWRHKSLVSLLVFRYALIRLVLFDWNDDLGQHVLSFLLQMWCTLVEAWYGVDVEDKETLHPSYFISLCHNLSHQVLHELNCILFIGFIPLGTQVKWRWLIWVSWFVNALANFIAEARVLFLVFQQGLRVPLDRLGRHRSIISCVFGLFSSTKHT